MQDINELEYFEEIKKSLQSEEVLNLFSSRFLVEFTQKNLDSLEHYKDVVKQLTIEINQLRFLNSFLNNENTELKNKHIDSAGRAVFESSQNDERPYIITL